MVTVRPSNCPRCDGPMYPSYGDDWSCLMCGEMVYNVRTIDRQQIEHWRSIVRGKRGRPRKIRPEEVA